MALFEFFGGKENDLTEVKVRKALLGVALDSDVTYPASATTEKIFNLGVFENNTIKTTYKSSKTIEIHTGAEKVLSMVAMVEGVGVSPWDLDEIQEIIEQTNVTLFVLDVSSYYSDDNFDVNSKFIPDNVAAKAHAIISSTQVTLTPEIRDKEVTRLKIMAKTEDSIADLHLAYMENAYVVGGDTPWLTTIFGDEFLDNYVDNNTPDKHFVYAIRSMCHMFWDWTRNNVLTQNNASQPWNHKNTTLVDGGSAVYDTDHYELGNDGNSRLTEAVSAIATGNRFGYFISDMKFNATPSNDPVFMFDTDDAATDDGFAIEINDADSFTVRGNFGAGSNLFSISSGNITGENFEDRATRIWMLDFKTETLYYYNVSKGIFETFTNSASNTLTFSSASNGVILAENIGADNIHLYKAGYAIW